MVGHHPQQAADEEMLARLELQQVAADRADQVTEQQEQQVVAQRLLGTRPPLETQVGEQHDQRTAQCLRQPQAGEEIGGETDQQQAFVGIAGIRPVRQADHRRRTDAKGEDAGDAQRHHQLDVPAQHDQAAADQ